MHREYSVTDSRLQACLDDITDMPTDLSIMWIYLRDTNYAFPHSTLDGLGEKFWDLMQQCARFQVQTTSNTFYFMWCAINPCPPLLRVSRSHNGARLKGKKQDNADTNTREAVSSSSFSKNVSGNNTQYMCNLACNNAICVYIYISQRGNLQLLKIFKWEKACWTQQDVGAGARCIARPPLSFYSAS